MKTSTLEILLPYVFQKGGESRAPRFFKQFKSILELLTKIRPVEWAERDLVWQSPWMLTKGRRQDWHSSVIHLYDGKAYLTFDSRHSFHIDLRNRTFVGIDPRKGKDIPDFGYEFLSWYFGSLEKSLKKYLKDPAAYNLALDKNLPLRYRFGKIKRKDLWMSKGEKYFVRDELTSREIGEFKKTVQSCLSHPPIEQMSSGKFLRFCEIGYDAVFPKEGRLSALEKYKRHADGRDDGLFKLDPEDSTAFAHWMKTKIGGGHPWEIVRGGNTTHISLGPMKIDSGWQLYLEGYSVVCTARTVRIANALNRARVRFELVESEHLAQMVEGEDWIGIVPENLDPNYDFDEFGERILNSMHLAEHGKRKSILKKIQWYPIKHLSLLTIPDQKLLRERLRQDLTKPAAVPS